MTTLRIALVASELTPFAKTGGLGDVVASLATYLHAAGHDVRPFLPLYGNLKPSGQKFVPVGFLQDVPLTMGQREFRFSVFTATVPGTHAPVYFIACPALYGRAETYSNQGDEHLRFGFLSRAAIECCQRMGFAPHVFHCNDWHTALVPLLLRTVYGWDRLFRATKTVLTIHNLAYQGAFPSSVIPELRLPEPLLLQDDLRRGRVSFLATGIAHADAITAVSRTYAREIMTPDLGMGLDALLRSRADRVVGIVNGIDDDIWAPEADPHIAARFSARDLSGKDACRAALLAETGLRGDARGPVYGVVSRLTAQKGLDLVPEAIAPTLARGDARLVALGSGSDTLAGMFRDLVRAFPGRAFFREGYDDPFAHRIEAGADAFVMPSVFEPCGLNQMYSLKYGTVPIVRKTGGLADTVTCYDPDTGRGTGVVFNDATVGAVRWAIEIAAKLYADRAVWRSIQLQGMAEDNSWTRRIQEYVGLYQRLCS